MMLRRHPNIVGWVPTAAGIWVVLEIMVPFVEPKWEPNFGNYSYVSRLAIAGPSRNRVAEA